MVRMYRTCVILCAALLFGGLSACSDIEAPGVLINEAGAELINTDGNAIGTATLTKTDQGVTINLDVRDLPPGEHGFHIHENGECMPPDFTSAGAHLALEGQQHGFEAEGGPHLGDLRNLTVSEDGTAKVERTVDGATLDDSMSSLLNRAIVIHADADDYQSQPSGAAGGRIACGVIKADFKPIPYQPVPGV